MARRCAICAAIVAATVSGVPRPSARGETICDLGRDNSDGVIGQDGGFSLHLGGSQRLWAFADTWLGVIESGQRKIARVLRSSGALQSDAHICGRLRYLRDDAGEPRQLIPMRPGDDPSNIAHWPLALVREGDRVIAFYQRTVLRDDFVAPINFAFLGVGVASASIGNFAFHLDNQGELLFSAEEYGFFDAVIPDKKYLYGLGCPPRPGSLRRPCRLGRVLRGAEARRSAYEVWDGRSWSHDISHAAELMDGSSEMSLLRLPSGLVLIYSPPFSQIVMRRAPALTGPWGEPVVLYQAARATGVYHYGAKAHEITKDGRFVTVTVNDNGPLEMHTSDPRLYWPHVLKLPLPTN